MEGILTLTYTGKQDSIFVQITSILRGSVFLPWMPGVDGYDRTFQRKLFISNNSKC